MIDPHLELAKEVARQDGVLVGIRDVLERIEKELASMRESRKFSLGVLFSGIAATCVVASLATAVVWKVVDTRCDALGVRIGSLERRVELMESRKWSAP